MLKIDVYFRTILIAFLLLQLVYSCNKEKEENTSKKYTIDGWIIDSITKNPVPDFCVGFYYTDAWSGFSLGCVPANAEGYFKAEYSLKNDCSLKIETWSPPDHSLRLINHSIFISPGLTHLDTIYLIHGQNVGGVLNNK